MEREVLWRHGAAHHLAAALRAAASQGPAAGLAAAARPVPLRSSRRPASSCRRPARSTSRTRSGRQAAEAGLRAAFEYSDCWVDDARLVVLNARDAAARGADDPHRARACIAAEREGAAWRLDAQDATAAQTRASRARRWSTPPARGSAQVLGGVRPRQHAGAASGWCRAATSSCAGSSTTTAAISSRTPTAASSSPSPTSATSR